MSSVSLLAVLRSVARDAPRGWDAKEMLSVCVSAPFPLETEKERASNVWMLVNRCFEALDMLAKCLNDEMTGIGQSSTGNG